MSDYIGRDLRFCETCESSISIIRKGLEFLFQAKSSKHKQKTSLWRETFNKFDAVVGLTEPGYFYLYQYKYYLLITSYYGKFMYLIEAGSLDQRKRLI